MDNLVSWLEFAAALIGLILIHEFGHFIVARMVGIEVEEFGIGIPPRAVTLFKAWGTQFTLNWLPFGGFVRLKGENDPSVEGGMAAANPFARLAVLVAGPGMNLVMAAVLFALVIAKAGIPDPARPNAVEIKQVLAGSPAQLAGLNNGDMIIKINNIPVTGTLTVQNMVRPSVGKPLEFTVQHAQDTRQISVTPKADPTTGYGLVGIVMGPPTVPVAPGRSATLGAQTVFDYSKALLSLPVQLIQGTVKPDQARFVGIKGMHDIFQSARQQDAVPGTPAGISVLELIAEISTTLGLINLLPFPALDGGRILFTMPEIILRRRIPPQYENMINLIGLAILLLLMIYINIQDFIIPATLPK